MGPCLFKCNQPEDTMHLFQECRHANQWWMEYVGADLIDKFVSLDKKNWINWNIKMQAENSTT